MIRTQETSPAPKIDRVEHTPPIGVTWHPYADIFPWIEGPALEELKKDIAKNGVLEPIVFLDGAILDGRNRYVCARELGIEYPRVEYTGDDPLGFVKSKNLDRRHLDPSQRAMAAKRLATARQGERRDIPAIEGKSTTQEEAAKSLNVSVASVERASAVIERGTPELARAVDEGKVSVSAAASIVDQPPEVQREVAAQPNVKKAVSDLRKSVMEAAKQGSRAPAPSNKNPHYQAPTKAGEAWTKLYGTCRALAEWASDENMLLALHGKAERTDDQVANVASIQTAADILNKFLGDIDAQ